MATYDQIRDYAKEKYGFFAKNSWIAHAKAEYGIKINPAHNRKAEKIAWPCPKKHLPAFKEIFEHFEMI